LTRKRRFGKKVRKETTKVSAKVKRVAIEDFGAW
jgi:hypothetical protein